MFSCNMIDSRKKKHFSDRKVIHNIQLFVVTTQNSRYAAILFFVTFRLYSHTVTYLVASLCVFYILRLHFTS